MVKTDAKKSPTIITVVESKFRNKRRSLSVSLHRQAAAIGADGDQALLVGAEDVGVMLLQAFNDGGVRVAVAVLKTVGDDGEGGGDGAEELFGAGGPAAVVGHFEHVDVLELVRIQHLALDLALHVAGEQEAAAAIAYAQNQGIVVLRLVVADYIPNDEPKNNDSLVLRISYGRRSFLLTGDVERQVEREMLDTNELQHVDVLKVAHHGSRTSSTEEFLSAVTPAFAVISDGFENSYGHPHPAVIERLQQHHADILRTDQQGLITIRTDGRRLSVETYR